MDISTNILSILLHSSKTERNIQSANFALISDVDWECLYNISAWQGVLAIVWNAIDTLADEGQLTSKQMPDKALKLQWALSVENIENRYRKQSVLARELAQIYCENGIKTIVLKGLALSGYYPIPEHRECGDLDCFLVKSDNTQQCNAISVNTSGLPVSCYDEGNRVAKEVGADVKIGFYKHSHIHYKDLMVRQQFLIHVN